MFKSFGETVLRSQNIFLCDSFMPFALEPEDYLKDLEREINYNIKYGCDNDTQQEQRGILIVGVRLHEICKLKSG